MLPLQTKRLQFQRYSKEDLPFIERLVTDPQVMRYIGSGTAQDATYAKALLERMLEQYENFDVFGLHKLVHRQTGKLIGHAGLVAQVIDDAFEIELGYWITPDCRQQGLGTETAQALKEYAIEEPELERFISVIQINNAASIKIAENNGMQLEKTIEHDGQQVHVFVHLIETN